MSYLKVGLFTLVGACIVYAGVKENLEYLFESKFPINDYVWQSQKGANASNLSKSDVFTTTDDKPKLKMLTDEFGNPILDEFGNPIYIDEYGNMYSKNGKPLGKKVLLDKNGNPILDKNGKPIIYDKNGKIMGSEDSLLLDSFGNPVLDKDGNPIFVDKNGNLKDKNGKTILDSNGKPINVNDTQALNDFLNQSTQNSLDEQLKRQQELLAKEAQRQKELQEQMRKRLEEEERARKVLEEQRKNDPAYQALLDKQEAQRAREMALAQEKSFIKARC